MHHPLKGIKINKKGWLVHLVSDFVYWAMVVIDVSSIPHLFKGKLITFKHISKNRMDLAFNYC